MFCKVIVRNKGFLLPIIAKKSMRLNKEVNDFMKYEGRN